MTASCKCDEFTTELVEALRACEIILVARDRLWGSPSPTTEKVSLAISRWEAHQQEVLVDKS